MDLNAVLFDVDGTIAESEEFHRLAFNESFKEYGLNWFWDEAIYKELIFIGGGKERIRHYITRAWPEMLKYKNLTSYISALHDVKSQIYEDYVNDSEIKTRPGVMRLIKELKKKKIRLGLVSSTSEKNLLNLFKKGLGIDPYDLFEIIAHGECTVQKKPSPDIYLWTLDKLKLPPQSCIAIEDAPRGSDSAVAAGVSVIVTPSLYTRNEKFNKSILAVSSLGEPEEPFTLISGNSYKKKFVDYELLIKLHQDSMI